MPNILIVGLELSLAAQLASILNQLGQTVDIAGKVPEDHPIQLIFTAENQLQQVQAAHPSVPVIVVSRVPEVSAWLHALEQGAVEYCGAPFEARQLRWALNSALARTNRIAAAAAA